MIWKGEAQKGLWPDQHVYRHTLGVSINVCVVISVT